MNMPVNMLWMGGPLGPIERLSIVSFLEAGHPVCLHTYDEPQHLPQGASIVDAGRITSRDSLRSLKYKGSKSFALAADYFRLKLMLYNKGLWADCDLVCLTAIPPREPCIFGWEDDTLINNAVLYLAADSAVVSDILTVFEKRQVPSWVPARRQREMRVRRFFRLPYRPQWGTFGPKALTEFARKHDLLRLAEPPEVFYPVPWADAPKMFDPAVSLDAFVRPATKTVHLWNSALDQFRNGSPPRQSPLGKLMTRFGV